MFPLLALVACSSSQPTLDFTPIEEAFPGRSGPVAYATRPDGGGRIAYQTIDGAAIAEGDIRLDLFEDPMAPPSAGRLYAGYRWPGGVVPYAVASGVSAQALASFSAARAHWEANSELRFVWRTTETDYILLQDSSGCSSHVGRIGGAQGLWLGSNCTTGNAIHELGHAVGLWHEHTRADRDDHVLFVEANADPAQLHNFLTYGDRGYDGQDLGPYEADSIMHYASGSFSISANPCTVADTSGCTLTKLDGSYISEYQRVGLTAGDLWGAHRMYFDSWQMSSAATADWVEWRLSDIGVDAMQIVDFDGDGISDIATAGASGIDIWDGATRTSSTLVTPFAITAFGSADFDGNGTTDFMIGDGTWWWKNTGGGWTQFVLNSLSLDQARFPDLDGDGDPDLLWESGGTWTKVRDITGASMVVGSNLPPLSEARIGDFDGDLDADLVVENNGNWKVHRGRSSGWGTLLSGAPGLAEATAGDFDGDGTDELLHLSGGQAKLLDGGVFGAPWSLDSGGSTLIAGDFDGDGTDDALAAMPAATEAPESDGVLLVPEEFGDVDAAIQYAVSLGGALEVRAGAGTWGIDPVEIDADDLQITGAGVGLTVLEVEEYGGIAVSGAAGVRFADLTLSQTTGYPTLLDLESGASVAMDNVATSGGAISMDDSSAALTGCALESSLSATGAGLLEIRDSTLLSDGTALNVDGTDTVIEGSEISAVLTGIVSDSNTLTLSDSTVTSGNSWALRVVGGTADVERAALSCGTCGAVVSPGTGGVISAVNVLISATAGGSGVQLDGGGGSVSLVQATVLNGSMGTHQLTAAGTLSVTNTVFVGQTTRSMYCLNATPPTVDQAWDDGKGTNCGVAITAAANHGVNADGTLSALSPLIDAGTLAGAPADDLAGNPRPLDGDGDLVALPDVGAYEWVP